VRQQCTRFIKEGYDIVTSLSDNSLAAVNPSRDTLVVVLINEGTAAVHNIDLSFFEPVKYKYKARAYRTSATENLATVTDFTLKNNLITVNIPAQSIMTFVIATKAKDCGVNFSQAEREYLIIPRHENGRAVSASETGKVTIQDINVADSAQRWTLISKGDSYVLRNANGLTLTSSRASNSTSLNAVEGDAAEQEFYVESVDPVYFKILSSYDKTYGLDLVEEKTSAGTTVAMWEYGDTTTPTHRQWMLFPLPSAALDDEANSIAEHPVTDEAKAVNSPIPDGIYDLSGRCVKRGNVDTVAVDALTPGIYVLQKNGVCKKLIKN
jgi:hypothetical protein